MREVCHIQEDAFSIRADLDQRLLDIKLKGYWDLATVEHFARCAERAAMALRRAGCPPGEQLTLVDNRALSIQSQDVVKRFDALIEKAEPLAPHGGRGGESIAQNASEASRTRSPVLRGSEVSAGLALRSCRLKL